MLYTLNRTPENQCDVHTHTPHKKQNTIVTRSISSSVTGIFSVFVVLKNINKGKEGKHVSEHTWRVLTEWDFYLKQNSSEEEPETILLAEYNQREQRLKTTQSQMHLFYVGWQRVYCFLKTFRCVCHYAGQQFSVLLVTSAKNVIIKYHCGRQIWS